MIRRKATDHKRRAWSRCASCAASDAREPVALHTSSFRHRFSCPADRWSVDPCLEDSISSEYNTYAMGFLRRSSISGVWRVIRTGLVGGLLGAVIAVAVEHRREQKTADIDSWGPGHEGWDNPSEAPSMASRLNTEAIPRQLRAHETSDEASQLLEQAKLLHATHLEEYKARRAEILLNLDASYKIQTLTITAAGVLVTGLKLILDASFYVVLGVAPLVFYALMWSQLRYITAVDHMSNHLVARTVPGLRKALDMLGPRKDESTPSVLTWEPVGAAVQHSNPPWLRPIDMAAAGTPLIFAVLCLVGYWALVPYPLGVSDQVITVFNILCGGYSVVAAFTIRASQNRSPEQKAQAFEERARILERRTHPPEG